MSSELIKHTEAAMALLEGTLSKVVYLPPDARKRNARIVRGRITTQPPKPEENLDRINQADPVGFLIALMNGQPIVGFSQVGKEVNPKKTGARVVKSAPVLKLGKVDGIEIEAHILMPTIDLRENVAKFLAQYVVEKRARKAKKPDGADGTDQTNEDDEFADLLNKRVEELKNAEAEED